MEFFVGQFRYSLYVVLLMIGLYAMIAKKNYLKKIIGMSIFQTAVIFFYIAGSAKKGATIPILRHELLQHEHVHGAIPAAMQHAPKINEYVNPLPHVLMLTAIVVGVATLGVALAITERIFKEYGTLEEEEIANQLTS